MPLSVPFHSQVNGGSEKLSMPLSSSVCSGVETEVGVGGLAGAHHLSFPSLPEISEQGWSFHTILASCQNKPDTVEKAIEAPDGC